MDPRYRRKGGPLAVLARGPPDYAMRRALELGAALLADAHLLALVVLGMTNTGGLAARGADEHHVGCINLGLDLLEATVLVLLRGLLGLLGDGNALDLDLALTRIRTQDLALSTAILAREDLDLVALLNVHLVRHL